MFGFLKKEKAPQGPRHISIQPLGQTLEHQNGDTILTTALEAGINFPHNCRVGGCATCKCKLVEGEVKELTDKSYLLSAEEMADNYILGCQSVPKGNVVVEVAGLDASTTSVAVVKTTATIGSVKSLTHDILELNLLLDEPMDYVAGQYADIELPAELGQGFGKGVRSYSFAQSPILRAAASQLSFHVRKVPNGAFTEWLHASDRSGTKLNLSGPYGDFHLRPGNAPILAIAGGSGMAPLKAVLEQAREDAVARDVLYLFGARTQADLYCLAEMESLTKGWLAHFQFVPVLNEEPEDSGWTGRRGLVTDHIQALLGGRVAEQHVYMCGPPPMIDAAEAVLGDAGVDAANIHYDKFLDSSHTA